MIPGKKQDKKTHLMVEFLRQIFSHFFNLARLTAHQVLHDLMAGIEVLVESYKGLLFTASSESHPLSKALRPVFQHKRLRSALGANLVGVMLLTGSVSAAPGPLETYPETEAQVVIEPEVVVNTESRFRNPVDNMGISQGYHWGHRAVDLRAKVGTPVYSIAEGEVVEVVYGRFGYGHYVVVRHADGLSSLYAHLGKVDVKVGEKIDKSTQLGAVGLTGWTTGAHLHLEVYENGEVLNPVQIINFN